MKRQLSIFLCALSLFTLSGCGSDVSSNSNQPSAKELDAQQIGLVDTLGQSIARGKEGYYFLAGHFLFYADPELQQIAPLCNKPNCLHYNEPDDEKLIQCNAFVEGYFLGWQQDSLYVVGRPLTKEAIPLDKTSLIRLAPDGSKREILFQFSSSVSTIALHNGYLYEVRNDVPVDENGNSYGIFRRKISNLKESEPVCYGSFPKFDGTIFYPYLIGDKLFFMDMAATPNGSVQRIICVDLNTMQSKQILSNSDEDFPSIEFTNQKLYGRVIPIADVTKDLPRVYHTYSLDGQDQGEFVTLNSNQSLTADDNYYFVKDDAENTLSVYDIATKSLITTVPLENAADMYIMPGDDHFLFAHNLTAGNVIFRYLDKTKLDKNSKMQDLINTPFEVVSPSLQITVSD